MKYLRDYDYITRNFVIYTDNPYMLYAYSVFHIQISNCEMTALNIFCTVCPKSHAVRCLKVDILLL